MASWTLSVFVVFAGRGEEVRFERDVNHLKCRDLRIDHRLKVSLQTVGKVFEFLSLRGIPPGLPWGDGVGNLISCLVIYSDWSSVSRDSSVALHWSCFPSMSRRATDLCRLLTRLSEWGILWSATASAAGSSGFSSWMPAGIGSRRSYRGGRLGVDVSRAVRTARWKFSTHVSSAISLCNSGSNGIRSSKLAWNLAQSVHLMSGRSGGWWKVERYAVLMRTGRWSELSAEDEVRYTGNESLLVKTMSKKSGLAKGL